MKISYDDKENINTNSNIPNKNKVTSGDMNNIKSVVNNNYDEFTALSETVGTNSEDITNLKNRLDTAENNISTNADDIDTLEGKVQTLETGIGNVYTKTETNTLLNGKANTSDIPTDLSQLSNTTTKFVNETELSNAVGIETTARENADTNLQNQIDGITASSDVVDIVGTYEELQNYDTQHLGDNDIIKVLNDSTHNNAVSYYRWNKNDEEWTYVGSEGPFYTKGETDTLLNNKVDKVTGKGLSTNDFTTAEKNKLDGIDLTNYVTNTDYATSSTGGVILPGWYYFNVGNDGRPYADSRTYSDYTSADNKVFISKGTLENVLTARIGDIETLLYNINRGNGVE